MRPYECLVIVDPRPTDEEVAPAQHALQEALVALGGEVMKCRELGQAPAGLRDPQAAGGHYLLVSRCGRARRRSREFERQLGLNEQVLRFLTTRVVAGRGSWRRSARRGSACRAGDPGDEEVG